MTVSTARLCRWIAVVSVCTCLAGLANAGLVVGRGPSGSGDPFALGSNIARISWTYTLPLVNVQVTIHDINVQTGEYAMVTLTSGAIFEESTLYYAGDGTNPPAWDVPGVLDPGTYALSIVACPIGTNPVDCGPGFASTSWSLGAATPLSSDFGIAATEEWSADGTNFYDATGTLGSYEVTGSVPEPATWALLGMGLALAGLMRRRRA